MSSNNYFYDNSINDNNKNNNYSDNKNNHCFFYNSINVNADRKNVIVKVKIEVARNILLPKFLPNSKWKIYQKNREGLKYLTKNV